MRWLSALILCGTVCIAASIDCTDLWDQPTVRIGDYCYYFARDLYYNTLWQDAQTVCRSINYTDSTGATVYGQLAMIPNTDVLQTLIQIAKQFCFNQPMVGCLQTDPAQGQPAGGWHWVDGDDMPMGAVNDTLWAEDKPDNSNGICENCGYIDVQNNGLDDAMCTSNSYPQYICDILAPVSQESE